MRLNRFVCLAVVFGALCVADRADAQSGAGRGFVFGTPWRTLAIHGGLSVPGANSDLFDFTTGELTLGRSDFVGFARGADLAFRVGTHLELAIGVAHASSTTHSEFRDWVDSFDQPIEQVTRFSRTPITLSVRYHPLPAGRKIGSLAWIPSRFDPFVGLGVGRMRYVFHQRGDFIDFESNPLDPPVIFADDFRSDGWANVLQGSVGLGWSVAPQWQVIGEVRYHQAKGDLRGDFTGFDRLDLSGVATHVGFAIRF